MKITMNVYTKHVVLSSQLARVMFSNGAVFGTYITN